jgi:spore maturation protein CgeB
VIKLPVSKWSRAHSWGDYHMAVLLKQQLEKKGHYVLLQIAPEWEDEEGLACDVAIVFRGLHRYKVKPQQINIMWNISHPDDVSLQEYEEYDQVFIASDLWAKKIAKQVTVPVETMLQCTDPVRFRPPNPDERENYHQQLLFVGNSRDTYRKILKDLLPTEFDLAVYGKNWKKLIPKKHIKSEHIPNDELYRYYGSADILLNDHWDDMREKGFVSNRIFDALACGAFVLTDKVNAMGELGEYVQVYETKEELQSLIDYYLSRPDERKEKALKGMAFVQNRHTFKERAEQFLDTINALMQQRVGLGFQLDKPGSEEA